MAKPRKKFVLVLVEGATEITALSSPITDLFVANEERNIVDVHFCMLQDEEKEGGDITSKYGVKPENIESMIGKLFIDPFFSKHQYLYPKNIAEIIHIVDLDGTFIDEDKVVFSKEIERDPWYKENCIETKDVKGIRERNQRKKDNLRELIKKEKITIRPKNARNTKTVDYSIYYFSSNMEYYLHHKANATIDEKIDSAMDFSLECDFDLDAFVKYFIGDLDAANVSYEESWEFIQVEEHSLERHTNLDVLIRKLSNDKL